MPDGFIPAHGGYRSLLAYQKSEIVFDATVVFCDRFIDKRSRALARRCARSMRCPLTGRSTDNRHMRSTRQTRRKLSRG